MGKKLTGCTYIWCPGRYLREGRTVSLSKQMSYEEIAEKKKPNVCTTRKKNLLTDMYSQRRGSQEASVATAEAAALGTRYIDLNSVIRKCDSTKTRHFARPTHIFLLEKSLSLLLPSSLHKTLLHRHPSSSSSKATLEAAPDAASKTRAINHVKAITSLTWRRAWEGCQSGGREGEGEEVLWA